MMDDLKVREAILEDKDVVLAIHNDVYDGRDYLPAYYDRFMASPVARCYVGELNGEIVAIAFKAAYLVDGETTFVSRAGRVSPMYAGQGIYGKFSDQIIQLMKRIGTVERVSLVSTEANEKSSSASFASKYDLQLTRIMHSYVVDPMTIQLPDKEQVNDIRVADETLLMEYIKDPTYVQYLFPSNRFIVDWVPYYPLATNIQHMKQMGAWFLSDVKTVNGEPHGLLTSGVGFPIKCPKYCYNMDVFGCNTDCLRSHIITHLRRVQRSTDKQSSLLIFTETNITEAEVNKIMAEFGVVPSPWFDTKVVNRTYTRQLLFSQKLTRFAKQD